MGVLPGPEAVGVCKLWGIRRPCTSSARNDAESPTNPCYKMLQEGEGVGIRFMMCRSFGQALNGIFHSKPSLTNGDLGLGLANTFSALTRLTLAQLYHQNLLDFDKASY